MVVTMKACQHALTGRVGRGKLVWQREMTYGRLLGDDISCGK